MADNFPLHRLACRAIAKVVDDTRGLLRYLAIHCGAAVLPAGVRTLGTVHKALFDRKYPKTALSLAAPMGLNVSKYIRSRWAIMSQKLHFRERYFWGAQNLSVDPEP